MTGRLLRGLMLGAAALVAVVSGSSMIGNAAIVPRQSRSVDARSTVSSLEPGFTGTFLYRNDNFRTGQNLAESVLTPSTVNPSQFGLLFTDAIDAAAYAQPLYVPNVAIPNLGTHNVVYVATETTVCTHLTPTSPALRFGIRALSILHMELRRCRRQISDAAIWRQSSASPPHP